MQSESKLPHSIETCRLSLECGGLPPLYGRLFHI
jgi:hypothetical protein